MTKLAELLTSEMAERGWSMRELAKRAGISHSQISNIVNGQANPGADFCLSVAHALNMSPEKIFRLAGILPPSREERVAADPHLGEAHQILDQLDAGRLSFALAMLRGFVNNPHLGYSFAQGQNRLDPKWIEQEYGVPESEWGEAYSSPIQPTAATPSVLTLSSTETSTQEVVLFWLLDQVAKMATPKDWDKIRRWLSEQQQTPQAGKPDVPSNGILDAPPPESASQCHDDK